MSDLCISTQMERGDLFNNNVVNGWSWIQLGLNLNNQRNSEGMGEALIFMG